MDILKYVFAVIAVMCIVYAIFRPMDVLSWWYVSAKNVIVGIFNLIKKWVK